MKMLKNPHEIEIEHLWWNVDLTPLHGLLSTPLPCSSLQITQEKLGNLITTHSSSWTTHKQNIYESMMFMNKHTILSNKRPDFSLHVQTPVLDSTAAVQFAVPRFQADAIKLLLFFVSQKSHSLYLNLYHTQIILDICFWHTCWISNSIPLSG